MINGVMSKSMNSKNVKDLILAARRAMIDYWQWFAVCGWQIVVIFVSVKTGAEMTIHHSPSTGHCTIICHSHTPETPVSLHNLSRALLSSSPLCSLLFIGIGEGPRNP